MDGLYHQPGQACWNQPLSPEMGSPLYAQSPVGSVSSPASAHSPLMHANSPSCNSPIAIHSPIMQAHSPVVQAHSPAHVPMMGLYVKQEFDDGLRYDNCNFSHLLKSSAPELIPMSLTATSIAHIGPPHAREILDGKYILVCILVCIIKAGYINFMM